MNDTTTPTPKSHSWAIIGGSALLVAGACVITAGVVQGQGGDQDEITFTAADVTQQASPTPAPTATPRVTRAAVTPKATAKPKADKATTSVPTVEKTTAGPKKTKQPAKTKKPTPKVTTASTGVNYRLYNVATGKCLGTMPAAAVSKQAECANSVAVKLERTREVNGKPAYWIRTAGSGLCLDPAGSGDPTQGAEVGGLGCFDASSTDNQEFRLENSGKVKEGHVQYFVKTAISGDCLDVFGSAADGSDKPVGQTITIASCEGGDDDHLWVFQEA